MSTTTEHGAADLKGRPAAQIPVIVNNHQVTLPARRMTGLAIKQAAIEQGADLQIGFQLSVKRGNRYKVVGDDDAITVRKGLEFVAVAADDNS